MARLPGGEVSVYVDERLAFGSSGLSRSVVAAPPAPSYTAPTFDPFVAAEASWSNATNTAYTQVDLPAFIAGDLIVIAATDSRSTAEPMTVPSGWTSLSVSPFGTFGSRTDAFWRRMNGDEIPSVVLMSVNSTRRVGHAWVIRGSDPSKAPESVAAVENSLVTTVNTAELTPSWGLVRTVWLHYLGLSGQTTITGFPAASTSQSQLATDEAIVLSGVAQGACHRRAPVADASEPVRTWTIANGLSIRLFAQTIAVGGS